jgi:hypothetical protein
MRRGPAAVELAEIEPIRGMDDITYDELWDDAKKRQRERREARIYPP